MFESSLLLLQNLLTEKSRLYALGLYNFVRGFGWAYKRRGLYPVGPISRIKKRFEMSHSSVDGNTFLI